MTINDFSRGERAMTQCWLVDPSGRGRKFWSWSAACASILGLAMFVGSTPVIAQDPLPLDLPKTATAAPPALAPDPEPAPAPAQAEAPAVGDLATRFRFIERYATEASEPQPRQIGQYRVASRDVMEEMKEKPQGAPDRQEMTIQDIYNERAAAVSSSGGVTDTVRGYEAFRVSPVPEGWPVSKKPLDGLTIWYKPRPAGQPLIMSLTPNRLLTGAEYEFSAKVMFLPDLTGALPALPSRIGDRWRLPKSAASTLLAARPIDGDPLVGTLLEVRKAATGTDLVAVVGVTGRGLMLPLGSETILNARLVFTFAPPPGAPDGNTGPVASSDGVMDARGAITEVRLARSSTAAVPGSNGRLRRILNWQVILHRQLIPPAGTEPLVVPTPPPVATPENSWLSFSDRKGRFHFRHPQELLAQRNPFLEAENTLQLSDSSLNATDGRIVKIKLLGKVGSAEDDKTPRDPDSLVKALNEEWAKNKQDVLPGAKGWLPEADWAPFKMKVFRYQAALKPGGAAGKDVPRIYLDRYLIQLTQNQSFLIDSMTGQDPPQPFRKLVEDLIKTIQLGAVSAPPG